MEASGLLREEIALLYEESTEKLVEIENVLLDIAQQQVEVTPELINQVFRAFHSVKGAAAYLLHEPMKQLSHKAESFLGKVREGTLELSPSSAEVLLAVVSRLKEMASDVDRCLEIDCQDELESLDTFLGPEKPRRIALNLAEPASESIEAAPVSRAKRSPSRHLKSLIVEDELTSRIILQDLLSKYGDCHVAVNGFEAVAAFRSALQAHQGYDLICMDVRMPVMDGIEAVHQIRAIEENAGIYSSRGIKIFMTTSIQDMKTIATAFKALCDTYLLKPIGSACLDEHLQAFRLLNEDVD